MKRRDFITLLGGAAFAPAILPLAATAQQARTGRVYRVGLVMGSNSPVFTPARMAFLDEMRKLGFIEGQNFVLEVRSNQQDSQQLLALMSDLGSKVDAIVSGGTEQTLRAAVSASPSIPIIMWANNFDPITGGYVKSLSRPGGNITGLFTRQPEIAEKQVELLKEMFPQQRRLAILWDAQTADQFEAADRRARLLGLDVVSHKLEKMPYDIAAVFRAVAASDPQMIQVASGPNMGTYQQSIVDQAMQHRLPAIYIFRTYVERGGLMSYGVNIESNFRRLAALTARVLNGASPADLPIEQPTVFEMVVNLKTAKALGVEFPNSILVRATEVIE